jgi:murein DD-endopeptidase MepM/ murein hydrolase activator NlpD
MQNKFGVYLVNTHDKAETWDYMSKLNPNAIRILDPSVSLVKRVYDMFPNALIFPRYWAISENQEEYQRNPVGLANQHVEFWKNTIAEYAKAGMDKDRFVTVSTNEPRIYSDVDRNKDYFGWRKDMDNIYRYNLEYNLTLANGLGKQGIKSCLLNLSTGHPANLKDNEPSYWQWAQSLVEPTNRYGHYWCIHEYFGKGGIKELWGWLCGRWQHIPFDVPIVVGEFSLDRYTTEPSVNQQQRGWQSVMSKQQFAIEVNSYLAHVELDPRVKTVFPFLTDYASNMWQSFDLNPARNEILKEKSVNYETYLPVIINTGTPPEPPVEPSDNIYRLKWPVLSPITQLYGGEHSGLDIALPNRTPIYALTDGDVAWVDSEINGYGNYVRVYHKSLSAHSFYAHFDTVVVKQGDKVKKGQLLGYSGSTGNSTGFHLHLELRLANPDGSYRQGVSTFRNAQVDPLSFLYALDSAFGHE